jgi:hypothetical protein
MTEEQRKAKVAEISKMVEAVALTEPGKGLLRLLHDICGYAAADRVVRSDGQIDLMATALNSERRNVYLQVRSFVPAEVLREVEIPLVDRKEEKK